jgi:hypothetical protein
MAGSGMTERETVPAEGAPVPGGPRVGLASYHPSDPEATFRVIEPYRPAPAPRRAGFGTWSLRLVLTWSVNLVALAAAGLVVTNVGAYDPFAYVAWAAVFGLANAAVPVSATRGRRRSAALVAALVLLGVDVVLVWLMTVFARPFHGADLAAIAKAAAVMWLANLPLAVLYLNRRAAAPGRGSAR